MSARRPRRPAPAPAPSPVPAPVRAEACRAAGADCSPDLCGRCILFVGGRGIQVQHFRRLVEERNGTLVYHDGGFEDGIDRLNRLIAQADTVMFPVDCISHNAHDQIKKICRRRDTPFVPVRRTGLGAFRQALETLTGGGAR